MVAMACTYLFNTKFLNSGEAVIFDLPPYSSLFIYLNRHP
jgi:hypothetical protein